MKAVMISIKPKWVEKIMSGEKTIEVRKTAPKIETPFKCYIYCTKDRKNPLPIEHGKVLKRVSFWENTEAYGFGKVIGEFVCDKITKHIFDNGVIDDEVFVNGHYLKVPYVCNTYWGLERYLTALSEDELIKYGKEKPLYGWHISDLKIYDKPKEISEFKNLKGEPITSAFQSWGYINAWI